MPYFNHTAKTQSSSPQPPELPSIDTIKSLELEVGSSNRSFESLARKVIDEDEDYIQAPVQPQQDYVVEVDSTIVIEKDNRIAPGPAMKRHIKKILWSSPIAEKRRFGTPGSPPIVEKVPTTEEAPAKDLKRGGEEQVAGLTVAQGTRVVSVRQVTWSSKRGGARSNDTVSTVEDGSAVPFSNPPERHPQQPISPRFREISRF